MDSLDMKRPYEYMDNFVKPKRRRKNTNTIVLPQDVKYAEIDQCSDVGVDLPDASYDKFDGAESIVGFYGADTPVKGKGEIEEEDILDDSKDEYDGEELFTEEDEDDDYEDDNDSVSRLETGMLLQEQNEYNTHDENESSSNFIQVIDKKDGIIIRNNAPYFWYQNLIKQYVDKHKEAGPTFFEKKINSEWTISKITKLKKKMPKAKQSRDEFLRIAEPKLKAKLKAGVYKKIDGIEGNVYTEVYLPVVRETDVQKNLLDDDLALSDDNMEFTLESFEDSDIEPEVSHVQTDNIESIPEPADNNNVEANTPSPTKDIVEAIRDVTMELTDLDIPHKPREDDEESTASDLDFFVSDEVKQLQKLHKIPNDILRLMYSNEEKLLDLSNEEDENESNQEEEEGGGHEKLEDIQEEDEDTNETIEEEQNDLEPNQVVVNTPKQLEEESKTGNLEKEVEEEEEEEEVEEELEEEEEVEEEEELEEVDENKLGGVDRLHTKQDIPTRVREDSSSTTGSVLSEIQNSPIVGVNQPPLPEPQVLRPSGEVQRKKIVLGCVGIPRDQLPYVKIVWVPTVDIIKAYKKFDAELFKLAHGPDGSSRVNNEDLMARLMEQTTHGVNTSTA
ncbi:hypothetical protein M8J76_012918 [Diaphorina citri]|nr:hypothetical protein M8J76_012918 [Diaphorina citri]KAI5739223.1 hypothetical protein M8J77_016604 [Diaphorina citri]